MSDKRAEILDFLEEAAIVASPSSSYHVIVALRGEVVAHEGDGTYCQGCGTDAGGDPIWPCPVIERIHEATVGALTPAATN